MKYATDREGRFDLWTGAPAVVIRKGGYASVRLQIKDTQDREDLRVVLRPASESPPPQQQRCQVERRDSHDVDSAAATFGMKDKNGK